MSEHKPPSSPYRGPPSGPRPDKRARERQRESAGAQAGERPRRDEQDRGHRAPADASHRSQEFEAPKAPQEQRLYGLNACLAAFAHRPESLRKVWLLESRIPALKAVLAWCVKHRLGYTVVEAEDLERLSGSAHHEGVVFGMLPAPEPTLSEWLRGLPPGPCIVLWLDGVGNPHNFGALARSAAHFGASALLLPKSSVLGWSGAAARVAEGGAEALPLVRFGRTDNSIAQLASAGFVLAATDVRQGRSLHSTKLPERLVLVLGAEQGGVDPALAQACELRLQIPGTGAVESLNVAAAAAVLLSEWRRQRGPAPR